MTGSFLRTYFQAKSRMRGIIFPKCDRELQPICPPPCRSPAAVGVGVGGGGWSNGLPAIRPPGLRNVRRGWGTVPEWGTKEEEGPGEDKETTMDDNLMNGCEGWRIRRTEKFRKHSQK